MKNQENKKMRLGGQAVIEGVMIKGPHHAAVAVRDEEGTVKITNRKVTARRKPPFTWPIFRGLVIFWQTLAVGIWALDVSAKEATGDDKDSPWVMTITMITAFLFGGALFFYLPLLLTQMATNLFPFLSSGMAFNILDGLLRLAVFILYIVFIGLIPGIRRVFEYHGAEHKMVSAFENQGTIDPEASLPYSTLHPRCGTAFLLTVMVVSIFFFSLIPSQQPFYVKLAWRLFLLPVIAGSSFEIIRLADKPSGWSLSWLLAPGLWLQKLTTREPDEKQLLVASAALGEVLRLEGIDHD